MPYVKGLARKLADKNVRANMVSPGNVYFKGGGTSSRAQPECSNRLGRNPTGRIGTEEVANAVVFLASRAPASSPAPT